MPRPLCGAVLALTLVSAAPVARAATWYRADAPHFTLYAAGDSDSVRVLALGLERQAEIVEQMGFAPVNGRHPHTVLLAFPDRCSFEPHRPTIDGRAADVGGYAIHTPYGHWIGYAAYDPRGRRVVHHEYTHTVVGEVFDHVPPCLNEGVAEYFSTFEQDAHAVTFGHMIPWHRQTVLAGQPMTPDQLFAFRTSLSAFGRQVDTGMFYAESWALVHDLAQSAGGAEQMMNFVRAIAGGQSPADAYAAVYPDTPWNAMVAQLRNHLQADDAGPHEVRIASGLDRITVTVRPAAPAEVTANVALWRLHADGVDAGATARLFDTALAEDPNLALAHAGRGLLADQQGRHDRAVAELRAALAGPADAYALTIAGIGLLRMGYARDSLGRDSLVAEGHAALERAMQADSTDATAREWFERSRSPRERMAEAEAEHAARLQTPEARSAKAAADSALMLARSGHTDAALTAIERAMSAAPLEARGEWVRLRQTVIDDRRERAEDEYNLGVHASHEERVADALTHFHKAHDLGDPDVTGAADDAIKGLAGIVEFNRGIDAAKRNDVKSALHWFEQAETLAQRPDLKQRAADNVRRLRAAQEAGGR